MTSEVTVTKLNQFLQKLLGQLSSGQIASQTCHLPFQKSALKQANIFYVFM